MPQDEKQGTKDLPQRMASQVSEVAWRSSYRTATIGGRMYCYTRAMGWVMQLFLLSRVLWAGWV